MVRFRDCFVRERASLGQNNPSSWEGVVTAGAVALEVDMDGAGTKNLKGYIF